MKWDPKNDTELTSVSEVNRALLQKKLEFGQ